MERGVVKFFNESKNYGFIKSDDGTTEYFVHGTNVSASGIKQGDNVVFDVQEGKKGLMAINVRLED